MARNRYFATCAICGGLGHSAKNCGLAALELRKDPFGEARRIREARELARSGGRARTALVMPAEPAPLISGARRV